MYGSDRSIDMADGIFSTFKHWAYISSETMGKERGVFYAEHKDNKGGVALKDRVVNNRRNIALLTIPPSGSLALLAGITSGIEPVFNLEYTRRRKVDTSDNVAFVDKQGDKWEEYTVYHPKYEEYNKPESYIGATAHDIDPLSRVRLQATVQKHIDHSISSTINLSSTATEEDVRDIYLLAYESGCKGVTIYRDGCRDGILISKKVDKFDSHSAPKRPASLPAKVSYASVKGEKFCILIGLFDGKPYELFAFNANKDNILLNISYKYNIIKVESGKYNLVSEDGTHTYGTITEKLTEEQAAITRLISTSLRHGADIKFIVEQLNKIDGDLTSFNKAMSRILSTYAVGQLKIKENLICPDCGANTLVKEGGCTNCKSCGYSACS
jgi:ribonucleoside-diphosphate reductase alpha chain